MVAVVVGVAFALERLLRLLVERRSRNPAAELDLVRERRRETAVAVVSSVSSARFLRPPTVLEQRELDDATLVRIRAEVPPTVEWLAEQWR